LGTFANGLRVGKTGTSTTVQTASLQIANSSKWQRMGLTCAGGEIKFMTDDNESGAPISPTFSFKNKLGAEFLHVDCNTGDLLLGGTLPAAPNITLKADGNISAQGAVSRVYADNAAAKAGGLVAGDVYRKADGTLMITF
jgi:hypothetical protein